jgi:neuropeptide S receptor 1
LQVYVTTIAFALFFIPAIIISSCYIIIVAIIWSKGSVGIATTSNNQSFSKRFKPSRNGETYFLASGKNRYWGESSVCH